MDVKNEIKFGLILIFIIFLILAFLIWQYKRQAKLLNQNGYNLTKTSKTLNPKIGKSITLTLEEVKKHDSPNDCWLIISGKVYEVSNYAKFHPGGKDIFYSLCGQDATVQFQTKGGKGNHSTAALQQLSQLYIGKIGEKINYKGPIQLTPSKTKKEDDDFESFEFGEDD